MALVAVGIVILLVLGYVSTKTRKNLLTVVAILSVLPMANQLVVLIAVWNYKSRPQEEYKQVASIIGNGLLDTELIITSKTDKAMEINYAYVHEKGIFCYSANKKLDTKRAEEYIKSYLEANDLHADIFFIREWKQYLKRLSGLEPVDRATCGEDLLRKEGVLRAIAI